MDDSDHSTTLSRVIRRRLLAGTAMATLAWPFERPAQAFDAPRRADPALLLRQEWQAAALRTAALCRKQQRLETKLMREIGFPRNAPASLQAGAATVEADVAADHAAVEQALAAHQARWDAADARVGYSATKREETEARERQQALVASLAATPAASLAGIAGKLDMILHEGAEDEAGSEFPWPQIRSVFRDLLRIGQLQPDAMITVTGRGSRLHRHQEHGSARA